MLSFEDVESERKWGQECEQWARYINNGQQGAGYRNSPECSSYNGQDLNLQYLEADMDERAKVMTEVTFLRGLQSVTHLV